MVQAPVVVQQAGGRVEVLRNPDGLIAGFLGRVVFSGGLGQPIPRRFAFLGRLAFVGMALLGAEVLGPVSRRFLSKVIRVNAARAWLVGQDQVNQVQDGLGATTRRVQGDAFAVRIDVAVQLLKQLTVTRTPFVEGLLQVADDEDAALRVARAQDVIDVLLEDLKL